MSWGYERYKKTTPISTDKGIKARSKRGNFAENWWAERWIKALERVTDAGRLRRGRSYARQGQVLSIKEDKGGILAKVQGSRATPYKVEIRMTALDDAAWARVIDALAERAIFTAQLLAGEMPQEIEEAFAAAGVSLFPDRRSDLETDCSCPDWANPCKHVAAAHYILGEQFDADPFLLLRLRGRDQEEIFAALRARRADDAPTLELAHVAEDATIYTADDTPPLDTQLDDFWRLQGSLEHFPTAMHEPATPLPVLRRLGQPTFLATAAETVFGPLYLTAGRRALETAYKADEGRDEDSEEQP